MIDFINISLNDQAIAEGLLSNPLLSFSTRVNTRTGKSIDSIMESSPFGGIVFITYPNGRIELKGSLHKFHNSLTMGKEWNHDRYGHAKVSRTIQYLQDTFGVDPKKASIHSFEYGVNIRLIDFNTSFKNFVAYKFYRFNRIVSEQPHQGWECTNSRYKIKIYNKGLHLGLSTDIMRIEKRVLKMQALETLFPMGIKLVDLMNQATWEKLKGNLLESLGNCIISDKINTSKLSTSDRKVFMMGNNPRDWEAMDRKKRHYIKKRYNAIIDKYGIQQTRREITNLMYIEFKEMLSEVDTEIRTNVSGFSNRLLGQTYHLGNTYVCPNLHITDYDKTSSLTNSHLSLKSKDVINERSTA